MQAVGLGLGDPFVVMRFVAWQAAHDRKHHGLDLATKRALVKEVEQYARVLITCESPLPEEFERYGIAAPPERIHDLLYYATLLIGDSQTMTTEAAVLGTPAIRCNSFVGPSDMANFIELEREYGLIYSFREPQEALNMSLELLSQPDLNEQWARKRESMLECKIDVTQFIVDFIENYPESLRKYKEETKGQP